MPETVLFENSKCKFYMNDATKLMEEYAKPKLKHYHVLVAERKENGFRTYVLYHKADPIYASPKIDEIGAYIDILKVNKKFEV